VGPNNLLVEPNGTAVITVADWEFTRVGDPIVDLAWCEWIVRTHHPDCAALLPAFFAAYDGPMPHPATAPPPWCGAAGTCSTSAGGGCRTTTGPSCGDGASPKPRAGPRADAGPIPYGVS